MKTSKRILVTFFCVIAFASVQARDITEASEYYSREGKGNFGLGIGGAFTDLSVDGVEFQKGGVVVDFNFGWALTERFLIGIDFFLQSLELKAGDTVKINGSNGTLGTGIKNTLYGISPQIQYFFLENAYTKLRAGMGKISGEIDIPGVGTLNTKSDPGFFASISPGYEFRLGRSFAISPQGEFGYFRINGGNSLMYGGVVNFGWYFGK